MGISGIFCRQLSWNVDNRNYIRLHYHRGKIMNCQKCGQTLLEGSNFCNICGTSLTRDGVRIKSKQSVKMILNTTTVVIVLFFVLGYFGGGSLFNGISLTTPMTIEVVKNDLFNGMSIRLKVSNYSDKMQTISNDNFQLIASDGHIPRPDPANEPIKIGSRLSMEFTYYFDDPRNPNKLYFQPPSGKQITLDVSKPTP
jgi:hypothetical protein